MDNRTIKAGYIVHTGNPDNWGAVYMVLPKNEKMRRDEHALVAWCDGTRSIKPTSNLIVPTQPSSVRDLHHIAMHFSQLAFVRRKEGKKAEGNEASWEFLCLRALSFEQRAIEGVLCQTTTGPTLAILRRSAASLAIMAGRHDIATTLIEEALVANPPPQIMGELYDLQMEILKAKVERPAQ